MKRKVYAMDVLASMELGLENCEVVRIDAKDIESVELRSITDTVWYSGVDLVRRSNCASANLILKKSADVPIPDWTCTLFERMRLYPDIVSIRLDYGDGRGIETYVPYEGDETNELQTNEVLDDGRLSVTIEPKSE